VSVRAGLANVQRGDVGVRRPQQPPQQAAGPDVERYNAILQSPEFQSATPLQQLSTVASWDLPAETKAPVVAAIKANMQRQSQTAKYNQFLQSEQFKVMKPETQIAMVQSWNLTAEQKAPVVAAIKSRAQAQKDLAAQTKAQTATPSTGTAKPTFTDPISKQLFANIAGAQEMQKNPAGYALKKGTEIAGAAALLIAPAIAVPGALIGTGISQGIKTGGQLIGKQPLTLLTGEETSQAFLGGAAFSVVGAGTVKALGLAGAGLRSAAGRVAVSTGLGAGAGTVYEYAETGKITERGPLSGAAFGLTFGAIGEIVGYGAGKISTRAKSYVQRNIEAAYRQSVESGTLFSPSILQRVGMKLTDVHVPRIAPEIVGADLPPPISFKTLQQGAFGAPEEAYFWDLPTPKSSEVYVAAAPGSRAKMWASETLIRRVSGGLSFAQVEPELLYERQRLAPKMPYIPSEPDIATGSKTILPKGAFSIAALSALGSLQRTALLQQQKQRIENIQITALRQEQSQIQESIQTQKQVQRENQAMISFNRVRTPTNMLSSGFKFEGPSFDMAPLTRRQKTRGRKRTYPILTGEEVLKLSW
jgi:hypothetical protein